MLRVVFLAVPPDIQILDLTGPFEVFARCGGYRVELFSSAPGESVRASCGLKVGEAKDYRRLRGAVDTLLVVGGDGAEAINCDEAFLSWLRSMSSRVRRIGSICTGACILGAAGILDDRRAVTHWKYCGQLAESTPHATIETDPIFVKDGHVYTSAGVTAGIDLALALVEEDHGRRRELEIARDLVMFLRRPGGQSQFSSLLAAQASSLQPIEDVEAWVLDHLRDDLSVENLAARCGMSPRHFARVFSSEKGMPPGRFIERARVQAARTLLEESGLRVKEVAVKCGFGSSDTMRRSFVRVLGVTAGDYAAHFRRDESQARGAHV